MKYHTVAKKNEIPLTNIKSLLTIKAHSVVLLCFWESYYAALPDLELAM